MKEVYYFECEICGKRFENEDDCAYHEWYHDYSEVKNDLILFNDYKEQFDPTYDTDASEICYAIIKSADAADYLSDWLARDFCNCEFNYSGDQTFIYYDLNAEEWVNVDKKIRDLREMKKDFSSWL